MKSLEHYIQFAKLFRYPDDKIVAQAIEMLNTVENQWPGLTEKYQDFLRQVKKMTVTELQEYFLKTFDVQAICYLDIGYTMFGEDYKRAQLLVNLQKEHVIAGIDCGTELADHLPNVLVLLAKTTNKEFAEELGYIITMPSIRFMLTKFKGKDNYYTILLEILLYALQNDFKGVGMKEFAFGEDQFNGNHEFLMPSPKVAVCDTICKQKKY